MTIFKRTPIANALAIALFFYMIGAEVQCPGAVEARESLASLRMDLDAVAADVAAITPERFELVGFTANTFFGDAGVLGLTLSCQSEFAEASRLCSSVEVLRTVTVPPALSGEAWVRPVRAAVGFTDVSDADANNCSGWTQNAAFAGLRVTSIGGFSSGACNVARAAACCAPAP